MHKNGSGSQGTGTKRRAEAQLNIHQPVFDRPAAILVQHPLLGLAQQLASLNSNPLAEIRQYRRPGLCSGHADATDTELQLQTVNKLVECCGTWQFR